MVYTICNTLRRVRERMFYMKRRWLAALLALALCISCFSATGQAASSRKQTDVEVLLVQLMIKYSGTYWDQYYLGATQCKGFADMISDKLYGTSGGPGPYSDSRYYLPNAESRGYKKIGILAPGNCTADNLHALFLKARPGDYVQCVRYTGTQHSLIVADVQTKGVVFFDCNLKGSVLCASYFCSWDDVASTFTRGCSLYRYSGYVNNNTPSLIFNPNGGTCAMFSKTVSAGSRFGTLPTPERKGYLFAGWFTLTFDDSAKPKQTKVSESTIKTSLLDTVLFARWVVDGGPCASQGHNWSVVKTVSATCVENGYTLEKCNVCSSERVTNITSALGHSWSVSKTVAPTCVEKGYTLEKCKVCNAERTTKEKSALGHDWTFVSTTKEATNVDDGEELYQCSRCDKFDRRVILCQLHKFSDLSEKAWYYPSVREMVSFGLMNGTSKTAFSPDKSLTRAMLVTILWRMEGTPQVMPSGFRDVTDGKWYTGAVDWASDDGVIQGYPDATFHPDDAITREQAAVILFRYAPVAGRSNNARADLDRYADAGKISSYAREAMSWANACGILSGYPDGTLRPKDKASRAQIAKMIITFRENVDMITK